MEKKYYDHPGIGPITEITPETTINKDLAANGEKLFQAKCISCHLTTEERRIGPGLKGVTLRRRPEWIMNQILNPMEMVRHDSLSKELFLMYQVQMIDMGINQEQARSILEYFRSNDSIE